MKANPYQAAQAVAGGPPAAGSVPNYLVQSILTTMCCCLPLGIVAIVYAAQVNGKLASGDYQGALAASKAAKTWCWVAFGLGLAFNLVYIGVMVIGAIAQQQH